MMCVCVCSRLAGDAAEEDRADEVAAKAVLCFIGNTLEAVGVEVEDWNGARSTAPLCSNIRKEP